MSERTVTRLSSAVAEASEMAMGDKKTKQDAPVRRVGAKPSGAKRARQRIRHAKLKTSMKCHVCGQCFKDLRALEMHAGMSHGGRQTFTTLDVTPVEATGLVINATNTDDRRVKFPTPATEAPPRSQHPSANYDIVTRL